MGAHTPIHPENDFRDFLIPFHRAGSLASPGCGAAISLPHGEPGPVDPASPQALFNPGLCETAGQGAQPAGQCSSQGEPCDPPAGCDLLLLADRANHPSLRPGGSIDRIIRLRARHVVKGHTPQTDIFLGDAHFIDGAMSFLLKASRARDLETRQKHRISAIGMLVALVDRDDHAMRNAAPQGDTP